jgi:S-adenosylmethionine:tRNA ribosyltransferase-isomerase
MQFIFDKGFSARVVTRENGRCRLRFFCEGPLGEILAGIGRIPLPPYIRRADAPRSDASDITAYQTVYATQPGAVAAPTAGLHFTRPLLTRLTETGVQLVSITLHVGHGTFSPVRVTDLRQHRMHAERFYISEQAAAAVNRAKKEGRRIIAVGTTAVRTLEHAADETGCIAPGGGECDLFIYPGYRFCAVDALITNFHLPESTLLMLVSAFAGRRRVLAAYRAAIREKYRFYSYGDAMLID